MRRQRPRAEQLGASSGADAHPAAVRNRGGSRRLAAVLVMVAAAALTACAVEPPSLPDAGTAPDSREVFVPTVAAPEAFDLAPLRGTEVPAGSLGAAALSAKIDNHPSARPQIGLNRTDIVFEELVEGGMTRYVAVWHSDVPKEVGPVRSIRPMDPDIISPFAGLVAYSGGKRQFVQLMRSTRVKNYVHDSIGNGSIFSRSKQRRAPHNVILQASKLITDNPKIKAPVQQFAFSADAVSSSSGRSGTPVKGFTVRYSSYAQPSWRWNEENQVWLRTQRDSGKDVDEKGTQLQAVNVIVMKVSIDRRTHGYVPQTILVGKGDAWLFTDGKQLKGRWSKSSRNASIVFTDDEGAVMRLAPGNTWIQLMPSDLGKLTVDR